MKHTVTAKSKLKLSAAGRRGMTSLVVDGQLARQPRRVSSLTRYESAGLVEVQGPNDNSLSCLVAVQTASGDRGDVNSRRGSNNGRKVR